MTPRDTHQKRTPRLRRAPRPEPVDGLSDDDLVERSRAGDERAYAELWRRHSRAGLAVARSATSAADPDDLVAEAFTKIFQAVQSGKGPRIGFRPYLFTTIRNLAASWGRDRREDPLEDAESIADPETAESTTMRALDRSLTAQAFRSLPDRWQEVLWYCDVEQLSPAAVAPLLGLTANGVSALAYRAREGLRQAWIQAHLRSIDDDSECRWVTDRMGAYSRGKLGTRETTRFEKHLVTCARCTVVLGEAREVGSRLSLILLPLTVGVGAATAYAAWIQAGHNAAAAVAVAPLPAAVSSAVASAGHPVAVAVAGSGGGAGSGGVAGVGEAGSGGAISGTAGAAGTPGAGGAAGGATAAGAGAAASAGGAAASGIVVASWTIGGALVAAAAVAGTFVLGPRLFSPDGSPASVRADPPAVAAPALPGDEGATAPDAPASPPGPGRGEGSGPSPDGSAPEAPTAPGDAVGEPTSPTPTGSGDPASPAGPGAPTGPTTPTDPTKPTDPTTPTPTPPPAPTVTTPWDGSRPTAALAADLAGTGIPGARLTVVAQPAAQEASGAATASSPAVPSLQPTTLDASSTSLASTSITPTGSWSVTLDLSALSDGTWTLLVTQSTADGRSAPAGLPLAVDRTALPPAIVSVDTGAGDLAGRLAPIVSGTAEAGATVVVSDGDRELATVTADSWGAWSSGELVRASAAFALSARQTDRAGNVSDASPVVTGTAGAPDVLAVGAPLSAVLVVRGDPGATVEVWLDGAPTGRRLTLDGDGHGVAALLLEPGEHRVGAVTVVGDRHGVLADAFVRVGRL